MIFQVRKKSFYPEKSPLVFFVTVYEKYSSAISLFGKFHLHYGIKKLRTPTFFKKKLRAEFLKQLLKQIINQNPVKLPWFLITFTRRFPYDKYKLRTTSGFMLFHASITFSSKFSQLTI